MVKAAVEFPARERDASPDIFLGDIIRALNIREGVSAGKSA